MTFTVVSAAPGVTYGEHATVDLAIGQANNLALRGAYTLVITTCTVCGGRLRAGAKNPAGAQLYLHDKPLAGHAPRPPR